MGNREWEEARRAMRRRRARELAFFYHSRFPILHSRLPKRKAPHEAGPFVDRDASGSGRDDVDRLARLGALDLELDRAVDQCVQRVVAAEADATARVEARAALAHDDVARLDGLA